MHRRECINFPFPIFLIYNLYVLCIKCNICFVHLLICRHPLTPPSHKRCRAHSSRHFCAQTLSIRHKLPLKCLNSSQIAANQLKIDNILLLLATNATNKPLYFDLKWSRYNWLMNCLQPPQFLSSTIIFRTYNGRDMVVTELQQSSQLVTIATNQLQMSQIRLQSSESSRKCLKLTPKFLYSFL